MVTVRSHRAKPRSGQCAINDWSEANSTLGGSPRYRPLGPYANLTVATRLEENIDVATLRENCER